MSPNIILAITNLSAILPIYLSVIHNDRYTAAVLLAVAIASFLSHLVENHKHGMPGIGFPRIISIVLNKIDVVCCIFVFARIGYISVATYVSKIFWLIINKNIYLYALPLILNIVSEYDKYNPKYKYFYVWIHSVWHISIFISIYFFLLNYIYV